MMRYTEKQIDFLRANYGIFNHAVVTNLFNKRFKTACTVKAIKQATMHHGITISRPKLPIGAEKIEHGYTLVKVCEHGSRKERYWKYKHRLIWEKANGPIPEGYKVIFLDKNKSNFLLDNLALATSAETVYMNHNGLFFNDSEKTRTGLAIARLSNSIHKKIIQNLGKEEHETFIRVRENERRRKERKAKSAILRLHFSDRKERTVKESAYKQEYIDFLQNIIELKIKDIVALFNSHFETDFNEKKLYRILSKYNIPKRQKNSSGFKGVMKRKDKWEARIKFQKQFIYIGRYDTVEEAAAARMKKEKELYASSEKGKKCRAARQ